MNGTTIFLIFIFHVLTPVKASGQSPLTAGQEIFNKHCARCHGRDGTKGMFGAKDLQASKLSDSDLLNVITNGRKIMPAWKKKLTQAQILLVIEFVKELRTIPKSTQYEK